MKKDFFDLPPIDTAFKNRLEARVLKSYNDSMTPIFNFQLLLPVATSALLVLIVGLRLSTDPAVQPRNQNEIDRFSQELDRIDLMLRDDKFFETTELGS